jgi:hypothetical protein
LAFQHRPRLIPPRTVTLERPAVMIRQIA